MNDVGKKADIKVIWSDDRYIIYFSEDVESVVPFPLAGKTIYKGKEMFEEFPLAQEYKIEYYPEISPGKLFWGLKVWDDGSRATIEVDHEKGGRYFLLETIPYTKRFMLEKYISWQDIFSDDRRTLFLQEFEKELSAKGIIIGIREDIWERIINIKGKGEVLVAEQIEPIPPVPSRLVDFTEKAVIVDEGQKIDFLAPKIITCEKDEVIAKIIPGTEGTPGKNIFGKVIEPESLQKYNLTAKKNCYVTDDGLEIRAEIAGSPMKWGEYVYSVERIYVVHGDVDIETGGIVFPGDVAVTENVLDSLYIHSNGRIEVNGFVSGAELKAETSIYINDNVFNSNIILGEKHLFRTTFLRYLQAFYKELKTFLNRADEITAKRPQSEVVFGQFLKTLIETEFRNLRGKSLVVGKMVNTEDETLLDRDIIAAVHTLKYFFADNNILELKNNEYLRTCEHLIEEYLKGKEIFAPENMICVVGYIQSSIISSYGDFICRKDAFNSNIKAEGDIKIFGTCRGSRLISNKKVYVYELGSSEGEDIVVKIPPNGHLKAEYCYPNVQILIGAEKVILTQPYRKLDVYYENNKLWVDKLKWF